MAYPGRAAQEPKCALLSSNSLRRSAIGVIAGTSPPATTVRVIGVSD
jgi:hypothetical protein